MESAFKKDFKRILNPINSIMTLPKGFGSGGGGGSSSADVERMIGNVLKT